MSSISYVNTDVQIQKIWGHSNNRELLRQYLEDKSVLTSWYVLLEYKATVVLGFIRFYRHLKHQSFDDALAAVRAEFAVGYKNYALMAIQDLWQLGAEYGDKRLKSSLQTISLNPKENKNVKHQKSYHRFRNFTQ